jgi:acetate kinase
VREIGALTAVLGGLDGIVFTGGVGENAAAIRERVCERLGWLGDLTVQVIPTDEERVMAEEALAAVLAQ